MNIWGLFDSGNGCYQKAVNAYNSQNMGGYHNIISIGIDREYKNDHFVNQDLSVNSLYNPTALFHKLDQLDKPDLILASPPCESWSVASAMKDGNACWKKETDMVVSLFDDGYKEASKFTIRNHKDYDNYQFKYDRSFLTRINGEMCCYNTIQIIKRYKPRIFVIENPAFGRIWEYIERVIGFNLPYQNLTYYSAYGYDLQKQTRFSSNVDLKLLTDRVNGKIKLKNTHRYNTRSDIPQELIFDILRRCESILEGER